VLVTVLVAAPAEADSKFAWTPSARDTANALSWVTVSAAVGLDTIESLRADDKWHQLGCQGLRAGAVIGSTELVKHYVHKTRPDGSDDRSFWSGHAANAAAASGWNYRVGITLAVSTGYLRMAANKHDFIDVGVGSIVGFAVSRICR
jgi:membrane-associated phospholipid phosphatase